MYTRKDWENRIRMEAASQAIENTIQAVEAWVRYHIPTWKHAHREQEHYAEYPTVQKTLIVFVPRGKCGRRGSTAAAVCSDSCAYRVPSGAYQFN